MEEKLNKLLSAVSPLDDAAMEKARERQAQLAKPPGSLGELENISVRLTGITGRILNRIEKCRVTVLAADNGVVIAASYWGKFKTTFQMIGVVLLILNIEALSMITAAVVWIALILTVVSLVDYIVKNIGILTNGDL